MERATAGDDRAFGSVAEAVQDELYRLALAHGLSRDDAAEATQETLFRAYRGRSGWKTGSDAVAWLCGIATNVVREAHRRRWRQKLVDFDPAQHEQISGAERDEANYSDTRNPTQFGYLQQAIRELPPRQREAVACRYLRRMSVRQTAEVMGCAEGTVKSAVSAALHALRTSLEKRQ